MPVIPVNRLAGFAQSVLTRLGMPDEHAHTVAEVMISADRYGVSSHGISKLSAYVDRVDAGVMNAAAAVTVEHETAAACLLNAGNGFGQVAAAEAMNRATAIAGRTGVGVVSVTKSNHFGIAGYYATMAVERGLIGIAMTNASPAMPPFNARRKLLGTNPIAFGIPAGTKPPIILDMSSTVVARGRIRREIEQGATTLPEGWAYDADGHPTTDPREALAGSLAPMGGAKGAGLALVVDILTGVLAGSSATGGVANLYDTSRPAGTAHLVAAIDPDAFLGREAFAAAVEETVSRITAMEAVEGKVYYPGVIEYERAQLNDSRGVEVTTANLEKLDTLAARFALNPVSS